MKNLLLLLLLIPLVSFGKVHLPSVISSGMVLQQKMEVKLWGTSDSDDVIKLKTSWSKKEYRVKPDASGNWSVIIETLGADFKHHSIEIKQKNESIKLEKIMFGEVWLCTGQSNMEMRMKGYYGKPIIGGRKAIADSRKFDIHIFEVPKVSTGSRQTDCNGTWKQSEPSSVANISATAYFFGRQLYETLNVPVGLIVCPWGGASIVAFMSDDAMKEYPQFKLPSKEGTNLGNMTPTGIFNGMINPVLGYGIRGGIWYQGETNRNTPDLYRKLYKSMLSDWRDKWGCGDFPLIYAQIAPFDYNDGNSAYIREAQLKCQYDVHNSYMVSLMDIGEERDIHPSQKEEVGFRMAARALDKVYNVDGIYSDEPLYKSHRIDKNKIIVSFDNANGGLTSYGEPVTAFMIAGNDRVFYPAVAVLRGKEIIVYSDKVTSPVAVRYAFTDYAKGNIYNIEGCCASSFRTDDWEENTCKYVQNKN